MATYIAQRKESFFGKPINIEWISQCGVSILTNQRGLCEFFNYFGIHSYSLFDAVAKLSFTLRLASWHFKLRLPVLRKLGRSFDKYYHRISDSLMTFESMLPGSQPLFSVPHLALALNPFVSLLMLFFEI